MAWTVVTAGGTRDRLAMAVAPELDPEVDRLAVLDDRMRGVLAELGRPGDDDTDWVGAERSSPELTAPLPLGVNRGDRRALYVLARALRPTRVLEVGTLVGASTAHLALAMHRHALPGETMRLVTLDVIDVNDPRGGPWRRLGLGKTPRELICDDLNMGATVEFVRERAADYLRQTSERFDLIFLDGDHRARAVYDEFALATRCLNAGGVIVLHDYFPDGRRLWPSRPAIAGPFLGMRPHLARHPELVVSPLGRLGWETKLGSNVTSLALALRSGDVSAQGD